MEHPGPHLVSVKGGTVEIYETHCGAPTPYPKGSGFFDPGPTNQPHVHTLRNPFDTEPPRSSSPTSGARRTCGRPYSSILSLPSASSDSHAEGRSCPICGPLMPASPQRC